MVQFRYFRDPHHFSTYTDEPQTCDICGHARAGYEGPFYSEDEDVEFVCEECLASGKLADKDLSANEGDLGALRTQLRALHTNWDDARVEAAAWQRTAELEQRTPHVTSWQDWWWPVHCGDYCCFLKIAGQPDIEALAPAGDARDFFETHLYEEDRDTDLDFLWECVRPDSPKNNKEAYSTEVYLFQCLVCGEYVLRWDCD